MTDRENSAKGFLERWSRKKLGAEPEAPDAPAELNAQTEPAESGLPERSTDKGPAKSAPKPEFDLASLPSLDSITAATDIRAFLAPGVPKELARAALRRVWSADPAIRDFKGLAENAWDFTDPAAMPGFGALPPGYDIKKLVAQIFGDSENPLDSPAGNQPPRPPEDRKAEEIASLAPRAGPAPAGTSDEGSITPKTATGDQQVAENGFVRRNNNTALHHSNFVDETEERKHRRQHGGALPQ